MTIGLHAHVGSASCCTRRRNALPSESIYPLMTSQLPVAHWNNSLGDTTLADAISDAAQPVAYPDTPSGVVADLIIETGIGRIPIVDHITHCVVGLLSRQDLLKARGANRLAETGCRCFVSRKSAANAMGPAAS